MRIADEIKKDKKRQELINKIIELNKLSCDAQNINWLFLRDLWAKGLETKGIRALQQELKLKELTKIK